MDETAINIDCVSLAYGSTTVLDTVSFTVPAGSSVAIMGPNGSGKTSLLNLITGLVKPTAGSIHLTSGASVAYVLQHRDASTWLPLTVKEVITMGCYRNKMLRRLSASDRQRVFDAAARLEIADLLGDQFGQLSGGQRQRVLLAQSLVQEPSILLLDEPITGLDLASQQRILDLVAEETARGTTVVITTHHLDEARHCDLVLLIAGRLVAAGPPDQVLIEGELRRAFGDRVLGDHHGHQHRRELLVIDDHGHGHT
ncbi:MAG: metal ABC transporter ATP-binding protein [Actinomycetia bacterium]|nr:metal ABC transporter ATP-binding protein [Actinomycetes bacterium]